MLIDRQRSCCLIIDVQERVCPVMEDPRRVIYNSCRLLRAAGALEVPVVVTEQNPARLGPTMADLREWIPEGALVEKMSFAATGEEIFCRKMNEIGRPQVIVAGIEAHVCVMQTALGLAARGYEVVVVEDACSSRRPEDRDAAFRRLGAAGVVRASTEMVLFEWLQRADHPRFRELLQQLIR